MSADKLDETAERLANTVYGLPRTAGWHGARCVIRAALDEAVAEERRALREIVQRYAHNDHDVSTRAVCLEIIAALAAREAKP